jgi:hypothetical protein
MLRGAAMSVLPPSLYEALEADASLWPGPLGTDERGRLRSTLCALPQDVRDAVISALVDPERNEWGRAVFLGLGLAVRAGARPTGMGNDDLVELLGLRGDRFGLQPLLFSLPAHRWGEPSDVRRLLDALDATFGERKYLLYLRRPIPTGIDPGPIRRAVHLWLSAIDRGERAERHAVYEDQDVAIDLTVLDGTGGGRVLTVGPVTTLERLSAVDARLVDAATRSEESLGDLPLVMVLAANRPWRMPRGYVQQLLYGTPDRISAEHTDDHATYEAEIRPNGRSLFCDPACRAVAALWWIEPSERSDPLGTSACVYENPWASNAPRLPVRGKAFVVRGEPGPRGVALLKWEHRP